MTAKKHFWITFSIILALTIITRLIFLDIRPLHHDEGNNYFFAQQIFETGKFIYDPTNYHGPLYFFALFLSFAILGFTEFSLRLPAAIFGILAVLAPFALIKNNGKKYIIPSLLLLASPSILYYSRYSIHESALMLFSIALIIFTTKFFQEKNFIYLPYMAMAMAFSLTTKETAIISMGAVGLIALTNWKNIFSIAWKKYYLYIFGSFYVFIIIYYALFSWFFSNPQGMVHSFEGFFPWAKRGISEVGHIKPFYYYLKLMALYEAPLLILGIFSFFRYFKNKNPYVKNFSLYFLVLFFTYSLIPYKMPWIVINLTAPLCVLSGMSLENISSKKIKALVGALSITILSMAAIYFNFIRPWQEDNPYAYVHTNINAVEMVKKVNSLYGPGSQILIASNEYWPLPFYFYGKSVQYLDKIESLDIKNYSDFKIFIVQDSIEEKSSFPEDFIREPYTLRPGVNLYLVYQKP